MKAEETSSKADGAAGRKPVKPRTARTVEPERCPHCQGALPPRASSAKSLEKRLLALAADLERGARSGDMRAASTAGVLLRQLKAMQLERKAQRTGAASSGPRITIIDDLGHGTADRNL